MNSQTIIYLAVTTFQNKVISSDPSQMVDKILAVTTFQNKVISSYKITIST